MPVERGTMCSLRRENTRRRYSHLVACHRYSPVIKVPAVTVIALDIFQTGVTSIRWQKWFTDQTLTIYMAIYTTTRGLLVLANT